MERRSVLPTAPEVGSSSGYMLATRMEPVTAILMEMAWAGEKGPHSDEV